MEDTRIPLTKPHFFKPLMAPNFRNEILIPTSFFVKYLEGQTTCDKAVLRSIRGKVWPVTINGRRRMVDGWTEFVKDHDLQEGDFLVFRHEGNMVFDVIIFDPSACEREYPPFDLHHEEVDDLVDEIEESKPVKHSNGGSGNPSFVATLQPSYIRSKILLIPADFSRQYLLSNGCREIVLRDREQRPWSVGLRLKKGRKALYFGPGWHDFCVANRLKEGDSFMFELIKTGNKPIMNFNCMSKRGTTSKAKASSFNGLERSCMAKQEMTSKEETTTFTFGDSHFCGIIRRSHLRSYQFKFPRYFAKSNGLSEECYKMFLRNKKGESWEVLLKHQKCDGQLYIGHGWNEFAEENGLQVGDKFKLELLTEGKMLIMNYYDCEGLGGNAMDAREMTSNAEPSSSTPKKSYFCGVIKSYNLTNSKLCIPMEFARSNGLVKKFCKMILRNQNGESWQVLLRHKKSDGVVYVGGAWNEFAVKNGLQVGDKFKLELVKGGNMLIMNYYGIN